MFPKLSSPAPSPCHFQMLPLKLWSCPFAASSVIQNTSTVAKHSKTLQDWSPLHAAESAWPLPGTWRSVSQNVPLPSQVSCFVDMFPSPSQYTESFQIKGIGCITWQAPAIYKDSNKISGAFLSCRPFLYPGYKCKIRSLGNLCVLTGRVSDVKSSSWFLFQMYRTVEF